MRKVTFLGLVLVLLAAPSVFGVCKRCNPGCQNAPANFVGWTTCVSSESGCYLTGGICTGAGGGSGDCWEPPWCEQGLLLKSENLQLAAVSVSPTPDGVQWQLVGVEAIPARAAAQHTVSAHR